MRQAKQPSRAHIERIAARQPELLNLLVAYFVMEWQQVTNGEVQHGVDQVGVACLVPNYVGMWGVEECVNMLRVAPQKRAPTGPGLLSTWLQIVTQG